VKLYSLENTKRDENQDNLYDLFYPMINDVNNDLEMSTYTVPVSREMRIDLICIDIFRTDKYIDELMFINNIIDPYSIKLGDKILYPTNKNRIESLQRTYKEDEDDVKEKANLKRTNPNSELTVSKPSNLKQVIVDDYNKEIRLTNKVK
jgi:hypothetical protein